jgi:hypothetical protein
MVIQKSQIKQKVTEWEEDMKSRLAQRNNTDIAKKTEQLREYQDGVVKLEEKVEIVNSFDNP